MESTAGRRVFVVSRKHRAVGRPHDHLAVRRRELDGVAARREEREKSRTARPARYRVLTVVRCSDGV